MADSLPSIGLIPFVVLLHIAGLIGLYLWLF